MQCRLSQKELLMANYDESNLHQAGRKLSNPSQKRSKTRRTYTKVMNRTSRRRRSTRRKTETYSSGPAVFGSERSCMEDNNEKNGGPKNSCVKEIEIPGFYYDPEKKRYFKITKDYPGKKLVLCHCGGWKDATTTNHSRVIPSNIKVTKRSSGISIAVKLKHREYTCHSQTPSRNMLEKLTRMLKIKQKLTLDPSSYDFFEMDRFSISRIEDTLSPEKSAFPYGMDRITLSPRMMQLILKIINLNQENAKIALQHSKSIQPDACHERILTLYETKPTGNQIVQFHDLLKDQDYNLNVVHNMAMMKNQKITGLLWSPHKETKNIYIVSLLGYGNISGETMIFEVDGASQRIVGRSSVHGNTVWTNSWNRNPLYSNMISIGASKVALTLDVTTKRRVIHVKCVSDVFAQEFSWSNPVLFNGSRDGCIRTCDVRTLGYNWPVMCLKQGKMASITCIRALRNENHLLSSGLDGSLKMWDLRAKACVLDYRGHVNEITHGLPFYVDPTDSLIFSAGQDSVTRIWSIGSGELLHTISFPESAEKSFSPIPALYYSEGWGGKGGMPGLLYGAGDSIYSYSY